MHGKEGKTNACMQTNNHVQRTYTFLTKTYKGRRSEETLSRQRKSTMWTFLEWDSKTSTWKEPYFLKIDMYGGNHALFICKILERGFGVKSSWKQKYPERKILWNYHFSWEINDHGFHGSPSPTNFLLHKLDTEMWIEIKRNINLTS